MNNQSNNNVVTDDLLAKYLAGAANPQEAMEVDDWVAASEDKGRAFHKLFGAFQATAAKPYYKPDTDNAWQQLKMLLSGKDKVKALPRGWLMAAAIVIMLSVAGWLYLRQRPQEVALQTAIAGAQSVKKVQLADGSKATLYAGSQLSYPRAFAADSRKVLLTGEAYFEVTATAAAPFVVEGNEVSIKVLGTAFNTATNDTAVVAEVYEGKILLYNDYGKLVVGAGQTGVYHRTKHTFQLLPQVNKKSNAYATMRFYFENDSLKTICDCLSKAYHKTVTFRQADLASLKMSSVFENQSLDYILEVIAATLNIQFTYEGNDKIVFTKE